MKSACMIQKTKGVVAHQLDIWGVVDKHRLQDDFRTHSAERMMMIKKTVTTQKQVPWHSGSYELTWAAITATVETGQAVSTC